MGLDVLQQPSVHPRSHCLFPLGRRLVGRQFRKELVSALPPLSLWLVCGLTNQPRREPIVPTLCYRLFRCRRRLHLVLDCMVCPYMRIYYLLDGRRFEQVSPSPLIGVVV